MALMTEAMLQRRLYAVRLRIEDESESESEDEGDEMGEETEEEGEQEGRDDEQLAAVSACPLSAVTCPSAPPLCLRLSSRCPPPCLDSLLAFVSSRPAIAACDLRACGLPDEATALLLSALLTSCRHVTDINLGGRAGFPPNRLGEAAAAALAGLLASPHCGLRALRLSSVGRHGLSRCFSGAPVLSCSASLTALDLSSNCLGNGAVRRLCLQLSRPDCRIRRLSLAGNGLTDACSPALASLLLSCSQLVELDIGHNALTAAALSPLAAALEPDTCALSRLLLDGNAGLGGGRQAQGKEEEEEGEDGLAALSAALQVNHGLQLLSCRDCGLRSVGSLARALQVNCCLSRLRLDGNRIGSSGCRLLLHSLLLNSSLQSLQLARCRLDDGISPALCRLVQRNPYLQTLDLRDNELTDGCVLPIIAVVQQHSHCAVSRLLLERNHVSGQALQRLTESMRRNARTQRLRLIGQYHSTIDGLRALPSHVRSCLREIEAVTAECERQSQLQREVAVRLSAQQQEAEAATAALLSQLERSREERRRQQAQHTQRLSELSASLSCERSSLKAVGSSLRAEIVGEKKQQLALQRQLSRAAAVWDSLEEIRRSGDGLLQSLRAQLTQATADRQQAAQQLRLHADRLLVAASRTVCSYWLSMQAFTATRRFAEKAQQQPPASASPAPPLLRSQDSGWAELEASGLLRFVPPLPPALGPAFDLELADFIAWQFSSSTPQAAIAHVTAALHNRMPVIALAQAIAAEPPLPEREAGTAAEPEAEADWLRLLIDQPSAAGSIGSASRRPALSLHGLLPVPLSAASRIADCRPPLFTGCTLLLHSPQPAAAAAPSSSQSPSSDPLLEVQLSSSCLSVLGAVAERVGSVAGSGSSLFFVPGVRLVQPLAAYRVLLPAEAPSLTLEEALAELDVGLSAARAERLQGLTAAAAGEADSAAASLALGSDELPASSSSSSSLLAHIGTDQLPSVRSASRAQTAQQRGQQEAASSAGGEGSSASAGDGSADCLQSSAPLTSALCSSTQQSLSPPRSGSRPSSRARASRRVKQRKDSSTLASRPSLSSLSGPVSAAAASRATSAKLRPLRQSARSAAGQEEVEAAVTTPLQPSQEAGPQHEPERCEGTEQQPQLSLRAAEQDSGEEAQQPQPPLEQQQQQQRRGSVPLSRSSLSRAQPVAEERILLRIRSLSVSAGLQPPQRQQPQQPAAAAEADATSPRIAAAAASPALSLTNSQPLVPGRALAALLAPSLLSFPLLAGGGAVSLGDSAALLPFAAALTAAADGRAEPLGVAAAQLDFVADARWWREDSAGGQALQLSPAAEAAPPPAAGLHWRLLAATAGSQQSAAVRSWPTLCAAR